MNQQRHITVYSHRAVAVMVGWWVVVEHYADGGERSLGGLLFDDEAEARVYADGLTTQLVEARAQMVASHDRALAGNGGRR